MALFIDWNPLILYSRSEQESFQTLSLCFPEAGYSHLKCICISNLCFT